MLKLVTTVLGATVGLVVLVASTVSGVVATVFSSGGPATGTEPSPAAISDIPGNYLTVYQQAAPTCPGLDWSVLAGIGKIETNHGRLNAPGVHNGENSAGAGGPMQFLQPTFQSVVRKHPPSPGGTQPPSRYNPHDAIHAAAAYLCDGGARDNRNVRGRFHQQGHSVSAACHLRVGAEDGSGCDRTGEEGQQDCRQDSRVSGMRRIRTDV